jgi:hypothetical protein
VSVIADPDNGEQKAPVAVVKPVVDLSPLARSVVGYGVGKVTVNVHALDLADDNGAPVDIGSDLGHMEIGTATLDRQGRGIVVLRSEGVGDAHLEVPPPYTLKRPTSVRFVSPVTFILAGALGGMAAIFLRPKARQKWPRALAAGALTGVVMATAYAVGIDWILSRTGWTSLASGGEAVVFILGFIGCLLGVTTLIGVKND